MDASGRVQQNGAIIEYDTHEESAGPSRPREFHMLLTVDTSPTEYTDTAESVRVIEGSGFEQPLERELEPSTSRSPSPDSIMEEALSAFLTMDEVELSYQLRHIAEIDVSGFRRLDVSQADRLTSVRDAKIPNFEDLILEAILSSESKMASESDIFEIILCRYQFSIPVRAVSPVFDVKRMIFYFHAYFHFCAAITDMVEGGKIRKSQEVGFDGLYLLVQKREGSDLGRLFVPRNGSSTEPSEHYLSMVRKTIQTLDEGNGASRAAMMDFILKHYDFEEESQIPEQFNLSLGHLISHNLIECICDDKYTYAEEEYEAKRVKKNPKKDGM